MLYTCKNACKAESTAASSLAIALTERIRGVTHIRVVHLGMQCQSRGPFTVTAGRRSVIHHRTACKRMAITTAHRSRSTVTAASRVRRFRLHECSRPTPAACSRQGAAQRAGTATAPPRHSRRAAGTPSPSCPHARPTCGTHPALTPQAPRLPAAQRPAIPTHPSVGSDLARLQGTCPSRQKPHPRNSGGFWGPSCSGVVLHAAVAAPLALPSHRHSSSIGTCFRVCGRGCGTTQQRRTAVQAPAQPGRVSDG